MKQRIRRIAYTARAGLFTVVIHGILIAALVAGFWWPFSENKIDRGAVKPIQAQAISEQEIKEQAEKQKREIEEKRKIARELEELKKEQEKEKKRLKDLEIKRKKEEKEREEQEKRKKQEELKKKKEAEKKKQEEELRKKKEAEKRKKEEELRKKKEAEEKKKKEEARAKREQELKDQLQRERTQNEAANALTALVDRIAAAVEDSWRRPLNSAAGLEVLIRVKVDRNGEVLSANVVKSSGDRFFDQSAEVAVKKASPLPFPDDPKYYEFISEFNFSFNPDDS